MTKLSSEITELRYDLRDTDSTLYTDAELVAMYNRVVRSADDWLANLKSDWVLASTTRTLAITKTLVALPSDLNSVRSVKIGANKEDMTKLTPDEVLMLQYETSSGQPEYYALHQANMIFERAAGAAYTIYILYNQRQASLGLHSDMPYRDRFNDILREAVALIAKNLQERQTIGNAALHEMFTRAATGTALNRITTKKTKLGF